MELSEIGAGIIIIGIILIFYFYGKSPETFKISRQCPSGSPDCILGYGNIQMEVSPKSSMGGGGLIKYPYRRIRGV